MTDVQLAGAQLEVLGGAVPDRRLTGVYLELLGIGAPPRRVMTGAYAEILVKAQPIDFTAGSSVFDYTGIERPVWRWDGTNLIPAKLLQ